MEGFMSFLAAADVMQVAEEQIAQKVSAWQKLWQQILGYLPNLLSGIIALVIGLILAKLAESLIQKALKRSRVDDTARSFLKSLVHITLLILVLISTLSALGVPTASLVAMLGAAGLAISLALQNTLSNLAGGFILLFTKAFKVGDFVEMDGVSGKVEKISIFHTRLLTPDNKSIYVPNGQVSAAKILNYTDEDVRRLDLTFGVSYGDDFRKAKQVILEVAQKNPLTLKDPAPVVRMAEQAASSIQLVMKVWVRSEHYWDLYYDMMEDVKTALDDANIEIPFPQLDVHMRTPSGEHAG